MRYRHYAMSPVHYGRSLEVLCKRALKRRGTVSHIIRMQTKEVKSQRDISEEKNDRRPVTFIGTTRTRDYMVLNTIPNRVSNRPISVYRFPCRALTHGPQLCMGIQPDTRFPARSADAFPTTLYGHFTQAIYRNRPIETGLTQESERLEAMTPRDRPR